MIIVAKWVVAALVCGLAAYLIYRTAVRPHALFCLKRRITEITDRLEMVALRDESVRADPALPIVLRRARTCAAVLESINFAAVLMVKPDGPSIAAVEETEKTLRNARPEVSAANRQLLGCLMSAWSLNAPAAFIIGAGIGIMLSWLGSVQRLRSRKQRAFWSVIDRDEDRRPRGPRRWEPARA
ncbi:MAG: hypothetical protein ACREIA_26965 [Opitutaceae bacterium]